MRRRFNLGQCPLIPSRGLGIAPDEELVRPLLDSPPGGSNKPAVAPIRPVDNELEIMALAWHGAVTWLSL